MSNQTLNLDEIHIDTDRFQPRRITLMPTHVQDLAEALDRGATFDPLTIWRDQDGTVWLVDGHHRIEALRQRGITEHETTEATGTKANAVLTMLGENGKTRLQLSREEKSQAAWMIITQDPNVKASSITKTGAASRRTITTMRKAIKWFEDNGDDLPVKWTHARDAYMNKAADDTDWATEQERRDQETKEKLKQRIGTPLYLVAERSPGLALETIKECLGHHWEEACEYLDLYECDRDPYTDKLSLREQSATEGSVF